MKNYLNPRSPLWSIIAIILVWCTFIWGKQDTPLFTINQGSGFGFYMNGFILLAIFGFLFLQLGMILRHNATHPKNKIKVTSSIPPEFDERDEGMQHIVYKATRSVYIYYTFAMPILAFLTYSKPTLIITGICIVAIGQYAIYWYKARELFR